MGLSGMDPRGEVKKPAENEADSLLTRRNISERVENVKFANSMRPMWLAAVASARTQFQGFQLAGRDSIHCLSQFHIKIGQAPGIVGR